MKNKWWDDLAEELENAADMKEYKCFSKEDATLYTKQSDILQRWAEHFNSMLSMLFKISFVNWCLFGNL